MRSRRFVSLLIRRAKAAFTCWLILFGHTYHNLLRHFRVCSFCTSRYSADGLRRWNLLRTFLFLEWPIFSDSDPAVPCRLHNQLMLHRLRGEYSQITTPQPSPTSCLSTLRRCGGRRSIWDGKMRCLGRRCGTSARWCCSEDVIRLVNLMPRGTQQGQTGPQARPWADGNLLKSFEVDLSLRFGTGPTGWSWADL